MTVLSGEGEPARAVPAANVMRVSAASAPRAEDFIMCLSLVGARPGRHPPGRLTLVHTRTTQTSERTPSFPDEAHVLSRGNGAALRPLALIRVLESPGLRRRAKLEAAHLAAFRLERPGGDVLDHGAAGEPGAGRRGDAGPLAQLVVAPVGAAAAPNTRDRAALDAVLGDRPRRARDAPERQPEQGRGRQGEDARPPGGRHGRRSSR